MRKYTPFNEKLFLTGLPQFGGKIGKALAADLWDRPVGKFEPISCPDFPVLDPSIVADLSQDSQHLYKLCRAVISGK